MSLDSGDKVKCNYLQWSEYNKKTNSCPLLCRGKQNSRFSIQGEADGICIYTSFYWQYYQNVANFSKQTETNKCYNSIWSWCAQQPLYECTVTLSLPGGPDDTTTLILYFYCLFFCWLYCLSRCVFFYQYGFERLTVGSSFLCKISRNTSSIM